MLVDRLLYKQINMSVSNCCSVLLAVSLFATMAYAYVPVRPMSMSSPSWYGPRHDSACRESIEDLKCLIELTNTLRHENKNFTCETCAKTFNEEVILKLINALILTTTHNCGLDAHQPFGGNNIGVWNAGGGYMGGNTILVGPVTGPGPEGLGVAEATNTGASQRDANTDKIDEALVRLGVLGENTLDLGIGNTGVLQADVGNIVGETTATNSIQNNTMNKDESLVKLGALDGKNTVGLDVRGGDKEVLGVNVGKLVGGKTATTTDQNSAVNKDKIDDSLVKLGVLDGKNTVGLDVGNNEVVGVNVGNTVGGKNTTIIDKSTTNVTNDVNTRKPTATASPVDGVPVSGMFAEARVDDFHAIMRKRVASLMRRVRASPNSLLVTVAESGWSYTQTLD